MANENLSQAKRAKKDEFYTQYVDIEKEMNAYIERDANVFRGKTILLPCDDPEWSNFTRYFAQNFERLGIRKLISTSYAPARLYMPRDTQLSLFDEEFSPQYDATKTQAHGRIFTLSRDINGDNRINLDDLEWDYLDGDGDFRSDEVKTLRDEADIIITNPPFSLFREFLKWIDPLDKKLLLIGNINAITYKEVFPLIRDNTIWLGQSISSGDREFIIPKSVVDLNKFTGEVREGVYYQRVMGVRWFTNLDHGRRHDSIPLMNEADNIRYSKHKKVRGIGYQKYDNYDAIEVPFVDAIPSDYTGVMGVPISFLDKYSPEQFEILGMAASSYDKSIVGIPFCGDKDGRPLVNKKNTYARIFIKHRRRTDEDDAS